MPTTYHGSSLWAVLPGFHFPTSDDLRLNDESCGLETVSLTCDLTLIIIHWSYGRPRMWPHLTRAAFTTVLVPVSLQFQPLGETACVKDTLEITLQT